MKPTVVQYPQAFSVAITELARVSAKHGVTAYFLSLFFAGFALISSCFYREIRHTFGYYAFGVHVFTIWKIVFFITGVIWVATTVLSLLCVPQSGKTRKFGLSSLGMNLAAAMLIVCTLY